jgi:hypothetical protein
MTLNQELSDRCSVVFHNLEPSDAVIVRAKHLLGKLLKFFPAIMHGTMTIEDRHRHHHQGNIYHVALRFHLPGGDVVVSHDPELNQAHEDIYVAMRDACRAARRQLSQLRKDVHGSGLRHQRARFDGNPRNSSAWGE